MTLASKLKVKGIKMKSQVPARNKYLSAEDRFWLRVNKKGPTHTVLKTRCWLWTGTTKYRNGYGRIKIRGKLIGAHKFSYILHKGKVPNGLCVLHKCDVRNCVNPKHLWIGTRTENTADMDTKGRRVTTPGEAHAKAILTEKQVKLIRKLYKPYDRINNKGKLADRFNVSVRAIRHIVERTNWRHI